MDTIKMFGIDESLICDKVFRDAIACVIATAEKAPSFAGLPVRISPYMPTGSGVLIDSDGKPIKFFKLSA